MRSTACAHGIVASANSCHMHSVRCSTRTTGLGSRSCGCEYTWDDLAVWLTVATCTPVPQDADYLADGVYRSLERSEVYTNSQYSISQ